MPAYGTYIGTGVQLRVSGSRLGSTVALAVSDRSGAIHAVTTSYLIERSRGRDIVDSSGWRVGAPDPAQAAQEQPASAETLLATIMLDRQTYVRAELPHGSQPAVPRDPIELLGKRVWKLTGRERRSGTMRSVSTVFATVEGGRRVLFHDAFEIAPDDASEFDTPNDGGALIVDDDDAPLGVLVASAGTRHFAAPLLEWLGRRGLTPLSHNLAARHNAAIREAVFARSRAERIINVAPEVVLDRFERLKMTVAMEASLPRYDWSQTAQKIEAAAEKAEESAQATPQAAEMCA